MRDDEGIELPDLDSARVAALAGAREMICADVKRGRLVLGHRIEVEDEAGAQVHVLRFGDAVEISP